MSERPKRAKKEIGILSLLRFLSHGDANLKDIGKGRVEIARGGKTMRVGILRLNELATVDLVVVANRNIGLTDAGRARLQRMQSDDEPFLLQHGGVVAREKTRNDPIDARLVNEAESPLAWLARRRGPNGRPLIGIDQFQAGERLRADFTRAGLTPRVTSNWVAPIAQGRRSGGDAAASFSDSVLAAKERFSRTLEAVGPEFAGILLDVCCFLKGLEAVERERKWPQRTAKVVLGLALDRLARHYGIKNEIRGPERAKTRYWRTPDTRPIMGGG
jgi:hypothetical protein